MDVYRYIDFIVVDFIELIHNFWIGIVATVACFTVISFIFAPIFHKHIEICGQPQNMLRYFHVSDQMIHKRVLLCLFLLFD